MNDKQLRDAAILRALHGIEVVFDDEQPDTPSFDGGPRIDHTPRPRTWAELALDGVYGPFPSSEPGWVEYEIENG